MKNKFDIGDFVGVLTIEKTITDLVKRFKLRRKEFGLTQKELSVRSGVTYSSIRRFEQEGEISLTSLLKIANSIGCLKDFNELFKNEIIKSIRW